MIKSLFSGKTCDKDCDKVCLETCEKYVYTFRGKVIFLKFYTLFSTFPYTYSIVLPPFLHNLIFNFIPIKSRFFTFST